MYKRFIKRFLDLFLSLIGLPFFMILCLVIAPLIYLSDRGPVFFVADRLGVNGKIFRMFKFRSMKVNAPDIRNKDNTTFSSREDPRVTKVGKILRTTSLDEVPQLLNILKGDMSFIGPRPSLPPEEGEVLTDQFWKRITVRPGLTGYTQAYFRNDITREKRFECDCYYADHVSFLLDLKIVFKTIGTVVFRKNLYHDNRNK